MRKLGLTGAAVLATFATGMSTAAAATVPSTVEIEGYGYDLNRGAMHGVVESPRAACLKNRVVRMSTETDGERRPLSVDRSSDNGFWGGEGTIEPGDPVIFRAKLLPKRLGPNRRCAGDTHERVAGGPMRARTTYPTSIGIDGASIGNSVSADGRVSAREACRKNRRVRIIALTPGGDFLVDADRASDNGFFGGGGESPEHADGVRASAPVKRLGAGKRCAAASDEVSAP